MAYNKYDSEKQVVSYMDGIPVKISEQYKPPKKISLPGAIINKLNSETAIPEYDFTLEKSVLEKMTQWRQLRRQAREARKERIEAEKQARLVAESASSEDKSPSSEAAVNTTSTTPYQILTPVPINASTNSQSTTYSKSFNIYSKSFNISDFEQDTASPFDNMELKTINDLEELAHVLQPTVISDKNELESNPKKELPSRLNGFNCLYGYNNNGSVNWTSNYGQISGSGSVSHHPSWYQKPNPVATQCPPVSQSYVVQRLDVAGPTSKSVPDILQQLEMELRDKREAESRKRLEQPQRPASIGPAELTRKSTPVEWNQRPVSPRVSSHLPNPYAQLSGPCQQLANRLAEMGFPLDRVARAAELFGDDETRVIEFLVQVQRLEEMNYPSDRAEKALVANNYKETETVEYLKMMRQLLDLGFAEEQVERALVECGTDRDKALDLLVS